MTSISQMRRRAPLLIGLCLALLHTAGCSFFEKGPVGNTHVPQPATSVDLARYLGRWYEIARYEASFQKDCDYVSADYSQEADGSIKVVNACRKGEEDAPLKTAKATAYVVDNSQNAKLRVSFFWPFYGDYWVLDHGAAYDWAIVGEPSGRYLWLLFRNPHPTEAELEQVKARSAELGYNLNLLRLTQQ